MKAETQPSAVVFIAGQERLRFTGEGSSVPQLAVVVTCREGYLEEFLGDPRLTDLTSWGVPVIGVLENEADAAHLVRALRLRRRHAAHADLVQRGDEGQHPFRPDLSLSEPIDCSAAGIARQYARNRLETLLDTWWRICTDLRLCEFPRGILDPAVALTNSLADAFRAIDTSSADEAWRAAEDKLRTELPAAFRSFATGIAEIVREGRTEPPPAEIA